jgi:hypothetical protein
MAFKDASKVPLFEGSTLSSFASTLIMSCCHTHGTSNTFIFELLGLFKKNILPNPNALPSLEHKAFKTMKQLQLAYNTIDVCVKGCMLFREDFANPMNASSVGNPSIDKSKSQEWVTKCYDTSL